MYLIISVLYCLLIVLDILREYIVNYVKIIDHELSNLSYNEKKNIIIKNFNLIKSQKIKLSKKHNNIYKQAPRDNKNVNLDLNFLTKVIDIDLINKTIHVEALITYEKLLDYTLLYGLIPKIVPEFKSLTVGGTISGIGLESSGFKYGLLPDIVYEFEVLTGTGDIITANKDINNDLYLGLPNTYGTLGYVISAKIELIETKPYVHIENIPFTEPEKFIEEIQKYDTNNDNDTNNDTNNDNNNNDKFDNIDFLDGMLLKKNELYLMKGTMVNEIPKQLNKYVESIYYKTINKQKNDYMTIKDYIWRYDSNSFYLTGLIENKLIRYYLGDLLSIYKLKKIKEIRLFNIIPQNNKKENITNDLAIQLKNFINFSEWYDENIDVYPVWICPYKCKKEYTFFKCDSKMELDFGIGFGPDKINEKDDKNYYKKLIDEKMYEMKSLKGLYSDTFLSKNDFWELYDPSNNYYLLKEKYDPNNRFYNLYEKAVKNK
jgi:hypothetical protein